MKLELTGKAPLHWQYVILYIRSTPRIGAEGPSDFLLACTPGNHFFNACTPLEGVFMIRAPLASGAGGGGLLPVPVAPLPVAVPVVPWAVALF